MKPETLRVVKAILEADTSVSDTERAAILKCCRKPLAGRTETKPLPRFLKPDQVADILQTSRRTVFRLIAEGRLGRVKLGHRSTRIRLDDVERLGESDT